MKRKLSEKELLKRKFKKFLLDNDALTEYERNVVKYLKMSVAKWYKYGIYSNAIMNAFVWHDQPEGHNFWSKLDCKWRDLIEK